MPGLFSLKPEDFGLCVVWVAERTQYLLGQSIHRLSGQFLVFVLFSLL